MITIFGENTKEDNPNILLVKEYEIPYTEDINCLSWERLDGEHLLIGTDTSVTLLNLKFPRFESQHVKGKVDTTTVWTVQTLPIKFIAFSPASHLFMTFGQYDRCLKVWYFDYEDNTPKFVYLSHARSIVDASWKEHNLKRCVYLAT